MSPFEKFHENRGKVELSNQPMTHEQAADYYIGKFLIKDGVTLGVVTGVGSDPKLGMIGLYLTISNFNKPSELLRIPS